MLCMCCFTCGVVSCRSVSRKEKDMRREGNSWEKEGVKDVHFSILEIGWNKIVLLVGQTEVLVDWLSLSHPIPAWLWGAVGVSRWLMGLWFLASLVLMSTYSGLLVATLTVPRVAVPIASVRQLVVQDELPWRLEQGDIILHTFKVSPASPWHTGKCTLVLLVDLYVSLYLSIFYISFSFYF